MSKGRELKEGLWVELEPNLSDEDYASIVGGIFELPGVVEVMGMEVDLSDDEDDGDTNLTDRTGALQ